MGKQIEVIHRDKTTALNMFGNCSNVVGICMRLGSLGILIIVKNTLYTFDKELGTEKQHSTEYHNYIVHGIHVAF